MTKSLLYLVQKHNKAAEANASVVLKKVAASKSSKAASSRDDVDDPTSDTDDIVALDDHPRQKISIPRRLAGKLLLARQKPSFININYSSYATDGGG